MTEPEEIMKVITGERASGKTIEAIELANEKDAYLVVRNRERAREIADECDNFPITYDELNRGSHTKGRFRNEIVIDNVDHFLETVLPKCNIEGVTMTVEEE